jgi:uncharacterized protein YabN with tetrapyrrole methylase and pyrophosphatase domain
MQFVTLQSKKKQHMNNRAQQLEAFARLLDIMDDLREKCPWDRKQTNETLRHLTIEETYELADAILNNDPTEIKKELGDVLLHIVFYAKIGSETNSFDIADVAIYFNDPDGHYLEFIAILDEEARPELGVISYDEWTNKNS